MAAAFPHYWGLTRDVIVVIPDGRYMPTEIPSRNIHNLMAKRLLLIEINEMAIPTAIAETVMVFLWVIREDIYPDPGSDMKYPKERNRKSKLASPWLNPRSSSMVGSNGATMIREVKFDRKIDAINKMGGSCLRKASSSISFSFLI